jgi:dTDP-4-amino-4,6-dideoxygalactose transaminase
VKSAAARIIVPFAPPVIGSEEMAEVLDVLESGWLSTGPRVREFERMFAEYVGSRHAIAVNSCTAALHLSLLAAGVGPGDEVITTPLTFCATANVIVHTGASPVFVDVDPVTRNLTPAHAVAGISSRTRALLPVDYAGRPVDAVGFRSLADREGIAFIQDAAHAAEAVASERKVGTIADATCFSFYATKNLTTGEGGMVTTNNDDWASQIRIASLHGLSRDAWARYAGQAPMRYEVVMPGFKYNMTDLQAALGIHQLAALEERLVRRAAISRRYDDGLAGPAARAVGPRQEHGPPRAASLHGARRRGPVRVLARRAADGALRARDRDERPLRRRAPAAVLPRALRIRARHVSGRRAHRRHDALAAALGGHVRRERRHRHLRAERAAAMSVTRRSTQSPRSTQSELALRLQRQRDSLRSSRPLRCTCVAVVAAGPRIGFGHLMRARTLAEALGQRPVVMVRGGNAAVRTARELGCEVVDRRASALDGFQTVIVDDPSPRQRRVWIERAHRAGALTVAIHDGVSTHAAATLVVDGSIATPEAAGAGRACGPRFAILDRRIASRRRSCRCSGRPSGRPSGVRNPVANRV